MAINDRLIQELLKDVKSPEDITGKDGLLKELSAKLIGAAMNGELTDHLGYEKGEASGKGSGNSRNGKTKKKVKTELGELGIEVPRDRNGSYEPTLIKKHQRRFEGFDSQIISMYARGMTTREIKGHIKDMYGVDVSPDMISTVTDSVVDEVKEWQNRPLQSMYPIVFMDALFVTGRHEGQVKKKAVYLALGLDLEGQKEVLGLWIQETEGAKFWLKILNELKNRGVEDILIACVDGLKGFDEAIEAVYPKTQIQLCIVHMVRNSLRFVSYKNRKELAKDLKKIYRAPTEEAGLAALQEFADKWDEHYPLISKSWFAHWDNVATLFAYPPDVRRIIYTTNSIESLNSQLRKIIKNRPSFPSDQAIEKILYLALRNIAKKWSMPVRDWGKAINQFAIVFEDRLRL